MIPDLVWSEWLGFDSGWRQIFFFTTHPESLLSTTDFISKRY